VSTWLAGAATPGTQGAPAPALIAQLRLQQQAAARLRQVRQQHGALVLESLEPSVVFDGPSLRDLRREARNVAMDLIEDLMVAANSVTARFLAGRGQPALRRVLRTPKHWDRIVALAQELGESLPPEANAIALSELLQRRQQRDPDSFADFSLSVVKLLGRGEYVVESPGKPAPGHFGLAVQDYTHATAPNRRYPDLITQRLLKAALAGTPAPYAEAELVSLATHCTVQEDQAAKVERRVRKSAAALLLADRVGQRFEAIVTGAADKGTWVRIESPLAEGRLISGYQGLQVGERVHVTLVQADVERGFIDFKRSD
jgi:exoribonuclease-2